MRGASAAIYKDLLQKLAKSFTRIDKPSQDGLNSRFQIPDKGFEFWEDDRLTLLSHAAPKVINHFV
jgi:hypothetical protein